MSLCKIRAFLVGLFVVLPSDIHTSWRVLSAYEHLLLVIHDHDWIKQNYSPCAVCSRAKAVNHNCDADGKRNDGRDVVEDDDYRCPLADRRGGSNATTSVTTTVPSTTENFRTNLSPLLSSTMTKSKEASTAATTPYRRR